MTSSTARPTTMAKRQKTKKISQPVIAKFLVCWNNNSDNMFPMKVFNLKTCISRIERYLDTKEGLWKYCLLKCESTGTILSYYHPSNGSNALDQETYKKLNQKNSYSLYIIPTAAQKRKTGSQKGITKRVYHLDEVEQYYTKDVSRIDIYQKGKKINSFNGKFLK